MTIKWVSVQVKRREIFGWAVESWPRGTRVPGACDKEKVANRSEAREVEKLVGQATWCIRGCGDMDQRPEKAKGALLGSMNRAVAFVSYGGIHGAEDSRMCTWSEIAPEGSLLSWKLELQWGSVEGWNLLERGVW